MFLFSTFYSSINPGKKKQQQKKYHTVRNKPAKKKNESIGSSLLGHYGR